MSNKQLQESDYKWFLEHYLQLFEQYGETYLAIKKYILGMQDIPQE